VAILKKVKVGRSMNNNALDLPSINTNNKHIYMNGWVDHVAMTLLQNQLIEYEWMWCG